MRGSDSDGDDRPSWTLRDRLLQYGLMAFFGSLIVAAFVYEAIEAAGTFGWIAYPLVLGTGLVCFLLSRVASRVMAESLTATVRRQELDAEADASPEP